MTDLTEELHVLLKHLNATGEAYDSNLVQAAIQRIRELEQANAKQALLIAELKGLREPKIQHLEQRIRELEDAILNHLVENGYQDSEETLNWWVEQHQPCDVRTAKLEALNNAD